MKHVNEYDLQQFEHVLDKIRILTYKRHYGSTDTKPINILLRQHPYPSDIPYDPLPETGITRLITESKTVLNKNVYEKVLDHSQNGYYNCNTPELQVVAALMIKSLFSEEPLIVDSTSFDNFKQRLTILTIPDMVDYLSIIYALKILGVSLKHRQIIGFTLNILRLGYERYYDYANADIHPDHANKFIELLIRISYSRPYICFKEYHCVMSKQESFTPIDNLTYISSALNGITLDVCSNPVSQNYVQALIYYSRYCNALGMFTL